MYWEPSSEGVELQTTNHRAELIIITKQREEITSLSNRQVADRQKDRYADRHTDRQAHRQTERQTDRDRQAHR